MDERPSVHDAAERNTGLPDTDSLPADAPEASPSLPDYMTDPNAVLKDVGVTWRHGGPPDYTKTRKVFAESKRMQHAALSLPSLVENLVKNWEIEASFKTHLSDWRTVNHSRYTFSVNGGTPQEASHMLKVGTYNAIIAANEFYSPEKSDFASSHKTFKRMMPTFAWEVLEVYSGPPKVAFRWRHWGQMRDDYVGFDQKGEKITAKAHQGTIDIEGVTVADLDDEMKVVHLETWFDPMDMFRQIAPHGIVNQRAVAGVTKENVIRETGEQGSNVLSSSLANLCPVSFNGTMSLMSSDSNRNKATEPAATSVIEKLSNFFVHLLSKLGLYSTNTQTDGRVTVDDLHGSVDERHENASSASNP